MLRRCPAVSADVGALSVTGWALCGAAGFTIGSTSDSVATLIVYLVGGMVAPTMPRGTRADNKLIDAAHATSVVAGDLNLPRMAPHWRVKPRMKEPRQVLTTAKCMRLVSAPSPRYRAGIPYAATSMRAAGAVPEPVLTS